MPKVLLGAEELQSLSVSSSERIATDCFQLDRPGPPKSKVTNGRGLGIFGPCPSLEADCRHFIHYNPGQSEFKSLNTGARGRL